jgi:hypothetical protein
MFYITNPNTRTCDETNLAIVGRFTFPKGVGISTAHYKGFMMQTHFDNPQKLAGVVDNSGVKFYFAPEGTVLESEFGVLQLGDPNVHLSGTDVPDLSQAIFDCPNLRATKPFTIARHLLHMHKRGARMFTQHVRDGKLLGGAEIEYVPTTQL